VDTNNRRPGHEQSGFIISHFVNHAQRLIHDVSYHRTDADNVAGVQFTLILDVLLDGDHANALLVKTQSGESQPGQ